MSSASHVFQMRYERVEFRDLSREELSLIIQHRIEVKITFSLHPNFAPSD